MTRPRRPSHTTVVAYLALFVALGGTGAYAANTIGGSDVINESLTGVDVRGKAGSESTAAVNGTITGADVGGQAPNAQNGSPFIDGSLTQWDIRNDSLTGDDIIESKLGKVPNANAVDGVDSSQLLRGASNRMTITLQQNSSTGFVGRNLVVPGFGELFISCPPSPQANAGQFAYTNLEGGIQEAYADDGSATPAQDTLGTDQGLSIPAQPLNDMATFSVAKGGVGSPGSVATITVARTVFESVISPGTWRCWVQAQAIVTP